MFEIFSESAYRIWDRKSVKICNNDNGVCQKSWLSVLKSFVDSPSPKAKLLDCEDYDQHTKNYHGFSEDHAVHSQPWAWMQTKSGQLWKNWLCSKFARKMLPGSVLSLPLNISDHMLYSASMDSKLICKKSAFSTQTCKVIHISSPVHTKPYKLGYLKPFLRHKRVIEYTERVLYPKLELFENKKFCMAQWACQLEQIKWACTEWKWCFFAIYFQAKSNSTHIYARL